MPSFPSLTVRAFAEMLNLPAHAQSKILAEQKYPKKSPQVYKAPYYAPALNAIRNYYKSNNDQTALVKAMINIDQVIKQQAKKSHNSRIIKSFMSGEQAVRNLIPIRIPRWEMMVGAVALRANLDVVAFENGVKKYLIYNLKNEPTDIDLVKIILELTLYETEQLGLQIEATGLEFIDLFNNKSYGIKTIRKSTVNKMIQNASIIEALWPHI